MYFVQHERAHVHKSKHMDKTLTTIDECVKKQDELYWKTSIAFITYIFKKDFKKWIRKQLKGKLVFIRLALMSIHKLRQNVSYTRLNLVIFFRM